MATEAQDHPNRLNAQKNRAILDPELACTELCRSVKGPAMRSLLRSRVLSLSSTSVEDTLQISYFLCKTNPISKTDELT
jgi:hypothetical protein